METISNSRSVTPFISIWFKPRETIRRIVETDPGRHVVLLAALAGVGETLDRASGRSLGDILPFGVVLAFGLVLGPIAGIISIYLGGALYRWSGSWLGGQATTEQVRASLAWSSVPVIAALPLWILQILMVGEEMFTTSTPRLEANPLLAILLLGIIAIEVGAAIWAFILLLNTLAEVHRFSAWKALGALVLGSLVIIVPALCIAGIMLSLSAI